MVICDSREKKNAHVLEYFDRHGIEYEIRKLDCGDYMLPGGTISIDKKKDLQELAGNLLNPNDKARFWREVRRARETGVKLVILCEHGGAIKAFSDVKKWKSRYGRVTGKSLSDAIFRLYMAYGVPVLYCDKRSTGKRIMEILEGKDADDQQADAENVQ